MMNLKNTKEDLSACIIDAFQKLKPLSTERFGKWVIHISFAKKGQQLALTWVRGVNSIWRPPSSPGADSRRSGVRIYPVSNPGLRRRSVHSTGSTLVNRAAFPRKIIHPSILVHHH